MKDLVDHVSRMNSPQQVRIEVWSGGPMRHDMEEITGLIRQRDELGIIFEQDEPGSADRSGTESRVPLAKQVLVAYPWSAIRRIITPVSAHELYKYLNT
jgi:hypothetical protein